MMSTNITFSIVIFGIIAIKLINEKIGGVL